MSTEQFEKFFEPYAPNVQGFYEAPFWAFSDALVRALMDKHLGIQAGQHILDAGGGTARWALWAAEHFDVDVTVADKSEKMVEEALQNVAKSPFGERVTVVLCDLEDAPMLADESFDAAISTYGVLSFLDQPAAAFDTLARVLKPGAQGMFMSHSLSNALHSKLSRDGVTPEELDTLLNDQIVRWAEHVPPLRVYSASDLRELGERAGFEVPRVYGVPLLTYPGPEDFGYPYEKLGFVSNALQDQEFFNAALAAELKASERPEWADRGVNLMVHVRKPADD
ncbi:methyltransferase domain-containing protein [Micromonospora sp. NPDC049801]|uniref:class I SAM-dependent methyltransferase n=1 Tax=unclassified Micromonospora TaxID=2617518 RepID=UPI0033CF187B